MPSIFHDFDLATFWKDSDYARQAYVEPPPTDEIIAIVEEELGVRLPDSYRQLMNSQNGGIPVNQCFPKKKRTSWADDHVGIHAILGIGRDKQYSLCGEFGSIFMKQEAGYPDIGVCVCDCPSAGHDMIMLDYRKCGPTGEPAVVHVETEGECKITFLAKNFETFIRGLVNDSVYDTSAEDLKRALETIDCGRFSTALTSSLAAHPEFGPILRNVLRKLALEKGCFAIHGDETSMLVFDILFYLASSTGHIESNGSFESAFRKMLAFGDGELTTGGYAPGFVQDYITGRRSRGEIIQNVAGDLVFSDEYLQLFRSRIREFS